jgi:glutamate racemase
MIGIFDSGFGGLTVLKALRKGLPEYDYIYFGDNARAPYGSKSEEVIYAYTKEAVDFLFKNGAEIIILACNTASAKALRRIQNEFLPQNHPDKKVLGVLIPAAEKAAEMVKIGGARRIGIIGTKSTISSGAYEYEIRKSLEKEGVSNKIEILAKASPLLVPLVEEGWVSKPETKTILRKYLSPLKSANVDVLILGCTHYPVLLPIVKRIMGRKCQIVDAPEAVLEKFSLYMKKHEGIDKKLKKGGGIIFYTSDDPGLFKANGKKFLEEDIKKVYKI